jgi:hypothetical protein
MTGNEAARAISLAPALILTAAALSLAVHVATVPRGPPLVSVAPTGPVETVFQWSRDRCETIDTPDAAPRAFRDRDGTVHLIASHFVTREMIGPSLDQVRPRCDVAFASLLDRHYPSHQNHQWLSSVYTIDGQTVFGLVHNEFHGEDDPAECPEEQSWQCWWNSVTEVISTDGGYHFRGGDTLVAALPYAYSNAKREAAGYFTPSNIVTLDGAWYTVIKATAYRDQKAGSCLLRSTTPEDPSAWRAWDGSRFDVRPGDPLARAAAHPEQHVCAPLANLSLGDVYGLTRDEASGAFVATMVTMLPVSGGPPVCGIWAVASFDLINWSTPVLVAADPAAPASCEPVSDTYPAILDPVSKSRNFETFGATPYLYFVRVNLADPPYDRRLLRQRIKITIAGSDVPR